MSSRIYIEGGGESKELHIRCRHGFRQLLEKCGSIGRMPRLIPCGGRTNALDDFKTAHARSQSGPYVGLLVDSEEPMDDIDPTWAHLKQHDNWTTPPNAYDKQVLLMTTCMETWLCSDRSALRGHFPQCLQESALPPLDSIESRDRTAVQDALVKATRTCRNAFAKGRRSFELVGELNPAELRKHLPSFVRCERVLNEKL